MPTQDELLRRILAAPEDDEPRITYADYLTRRGDPRGEFITVQLRLAELYREQGSHEEIAGLVPRQRALLAEHRAAWMAPLVGLVRGASFHRGFPEEVDVLAADFPAVAPALSRVAPVLHLNALEAAGQMAALAASPSLAPLASLNLYNQKIGDDGARALAASPHLGRLTWLELGYCRITVAGLTALFASRGLPRLSWLGFRENAAEDPVDLPEGFDDDAIIGWEPSPLGESLEQRHGKKRWLHFHADSSTFYPPDRGAFLGSP